MIPVARPYRRALSIPEYVAASKRIERGEPRAEIAREYNIHCEVLRRALVSLGLPWKSCDDNHGLTWRRRYILEQLEAGRTRHELAVELDTSPQCISVTASVARKKIGKTLERPVPELSRRQKIVMAMTRKRFCDSIIAERLRITQNAVRSTRYKARGKLAACTPSSR